MRHLGVLLVAFFGCSSPQSRVPLLERPSAARAASEPASAVAPAVFDVTRFGARADDAQDDTLAIQRAIDAAKLTPGGSVVLPKGVFRVSDQPPLDQVALSIVSARHLTLRGAGADATTLLLDSPGDAHVIAVVDAADLTITQLGVDGSRAQHRLAHAVRVADAEDLRLTDLKIRAVAEYGIGLQQGALKRILIQRVDIDDTGCDGIDFKNDRNQNQQLVLRDLHVSRFGQAAPRQAGIDIRGPAEIDNVVVLGVPDGSSGIRFREDGPETGRGGHDSRLTRFDVQGSPGSIGVAIAAERVSVSGGTIHGTDVGVLVQAADASVSDVRVVGSSGYAVWVLPGVAGARLRGLHVEASVVGAWLEGNRTKLEASSFDGLLKCGICVRSAALGTRIVENTFSGNASDVDDQGERTER